MKVIFMGTPDFCIPVLSSIEKAGHDILMCVSMPDAPVGRRQTLKSPPVKEWAISREITVFQPERLRDKEAVEAIRSYDADIIVVAAYGQILPKEVLSMPRFGCINVHASLLPKYRGASPIQWAIINGDEKTGITIMQMDEGLDDGDILLQKELAISPEDTGGTLFEKLARMGGEACAEALSAIEEGSVKAVPQDDNKATKVGKIDRSLGRIDFNRSAEELSRLVRGLSPWPGTYCLFRGKNLKVHSAEAVFDVPESFSPGQTISADGHHWTVACQKGALSLKEVQLAGKKAMSADEFLRGHRVEQGEMLS